MHTFPSISLPFCSQVLLPPVKLRHERENRVQIGAEPARERGTDGKAVHVTIPSVTCGGILQLQASRHACGSPRALGRLRRGIRRLWVARHALDVGVLVGDRTKGIDVVAPQGHGQRRGGEEKEQLHVGQRGGRREAL